MQYAPMSPTRCVQENRKMRFLDVYDGWNEGRLTQAEAAQILEQCGRSFRRHIERFESDGLQGLFDKRLSGHQHGPLHCAGTGDDLFGDGAGQRPNLAFIAVLAVQGARRSRTQPGSGPVAASR